MEGWGDGSGEGGSPEEVERAGRPGWEGGLGACWAGSRWPGRLGQIGERNRKMCLRILADVFWNLNQGDFGSKYFKGL
jgi:hypothetical protein